MDARWMFAVVLAALVVTSGPGCERRREGASGAEEASSAEAQEVEPDAIRLQQVADLTVPDEVLVDQDGRAVRLRELLEGRRAAVNFVFTTCTSICSPMTAIFASLARDLGGALDRDVRLVTISLDPATDTPERLARYAARFERRAGWTFLTGPPERVRRVLDALRGERGPKEDHSAVTLLRGPAGDRWVRVLGLAPAARLRAELDALARPAAEVAGCAELSPAARRGKTLFRRGLVASGAPVTARIGGGASRLIGRDAACAGCHTLTGEGAGEGGIGVPPITPAHLFREAARRGDRPRPPYDEASLAAAIREGRSSSGRALGAGMPRYLLTAEDTADLVAYLRCVGQDDEPGVSDTAVRVGAAVPLTGPLAGVGEDVRAVLAASFADVSARGGVFRRRIELVVEDSGAPGGEAGAALRLASAGVLALVGSVWAGEPLPALPPGDDDLPLVAPVGPLDRGLSGAVIEGTEGNVFFLYPDDAQLARLAVRAFAVGGPSARGRWLVAHARGQVGERWLLGAREEGARRRLPAPAVVAFDAGHLDGAALVDAARAHRAEGVLFWGDAADLERAARALAALPGVVLAAPGHLLAAGRAAVPAGLRGRVHYVAQVAGAEVGSEAAADLDDLSRRHGLTLRNLAAAGRARVAALVLVEALKRAGSRPSRAGLVAALEAFRGFETGLAPPLSYGKGRRVGALAGALVQAAGEGGVTVLAQIPE